MKNKLLIPDAKTYKIDSNEIVPGAVFLVRMSGPDVGAKREISSVLDFSKSPDYKPGTQHRLLITGVEGRIYAYDIDGNNPIVYDREAGVITFSSEGNEYMIRAAQDYELLDARLYPYTKGNG